MEIKLAEKFRGEIENRILQLIGDFEQQTGLVVECIDLEHTQAIGDPKPKIRAVSLKVAL